MSFEECLRKIDESVVDVLRAIPDDPHLSQWVRDYACNHRYRLAHDLIMVRQHATPRIKILEYGSSPFYLTCALKRAGYHVHGLDIAPERFSRIVSECELDVQKVDFEREAVPFPDETFDVILFNEVFEHLRINLIFTMSEVRRVMKTGGTLLLSTPNHRSLVGIWTLLWHQLGSHVCPDLYHEHNKLTLYGHMGHVREYTAREVSLFLSKVGLRTKRVIFRYYGPLATTPFSLLVVRNILEKAVCTIVPGLRPLFTLVCKKEQPVSEPSQPTSLMTEGKPSP